MCGQIVNSLSADKSGMFYYAVDSLIHTLKNEQSIERVILRADGREIDAFPDEIRGIKIVKDDSKKLKPNDFRDNDVLFRITGLSIIRNQITLSIWTMGKEEKRITSFADGLYIFYFKYLPDTETYILTKIKKGIRQ